MHTSLPFPYAPLIYAGPLSVGKSIRLDSRQAAALQFRQINLSEAFTLGDSTGRWFRASLRQTGDRGGEALVYEEMPHSPESPLALTLVCAVLARQRMMFVVQKATELGATWIFPALTDRSVAQEGLEHEKAHAWPNQVLRACKQCRRASVPLLSDPLPLAAALRSPSWRQAEVRWYLDDRAGHPHLLTAGPASAGLAVGPEGGWTPGEQELLEAAGAGPIVLGGRVLRAETAMVAGMVLVQHHLGDL